LFTSEEDLRAKIKEKTPIGRIFEKKKGTFLWAWVNGEDSSGRFSAMEGEREVTTLPADPTREKTYQRVGGLVKTR